MRTMLGHVDVLCSPGIALDDLHGVVKRTKLMANLLLQPVFDVALLCRPYILKLLVRFGHTIVYRALYEGQEAYGGGVSGHASLAELCFASWGN